MCALQIFLMYTKISVHMMNKTQINLVKNWDLFQLKEILRDSSHAQKKIYLVSGDFVHYSIKQNIFIHSFYLNKVFTINIRYIIWYLRFLLKMNDITHLQTCHRWVRPTFILTDTQSYRTHFICMHTCTC